MQYRTRIWHFPLIATTAALWAGFALPASAQQGEEVTINVTAAQNIDATGNGHVRWVMNFNPPRGYDRVKRNYPNLYVLFRDFGPERSSFEIDRNTLKINSDDGQRSITFIADVWGAAVSRKNRWQVELDRSEQITTQDANKVFTVSQLGSQNGLKIISINTYVFPQNAQNVQFDKETRLLSYTLPAIKAPVQAGEPEVDVSMRYKKRLMSACTRCTETAKLRVALTGWPRPFSRIPARLPFMA